MYAIPGERVHSFRLSRPPKPYDACFHLLGCPSPCLPGIVARLTLCTAGVSCTCRHTCRPCCLPACPLDSLLACCMFEGRASSHRSEQRLLAPRPPPLQLQLATESRPAQPCSQEHASCQILQVKLSKDVAQAYALAKLGQGQEQADKALALFTATGTAVLIQGKLTKTPEGTKQVLPSTSACARRVPACQAATVNHLDAACAPLQPWLRHVLARCVPSHPLAGCISALAPVPWHMLRA